MTENQVIINRLISAVQEMRARKRDMIQTLCDAQSVVTSTRASIENYTLTISDLTEQIDRLQKKERQ